MASTWSYSSATSVARRAGHLIIGPAGFSLLETLVVVSVAGVMLAMAVPSVATALADAKANAGMRTVQSALMAGRDHALSQRRVVEVRFIGQNKIRTTRIEGSTRTILATTRLEQGMRFRLTPGVPDTPDAFGRSAAIAFGGGRRLFFQPNGSLTDATGLPVSGTVFLGMEQRTTLSARAVTVLGPTGRVVGYRWDGLEWR